MQIGLLAGQAGVVITQRDEIHRALLQGLLVTGVELDVDVVLIVVAQGVAGIVAAHHNVTVEVFHLVVLHIPEHILGAVADGIGQVGAEHHTNLVIRVDFVCNLGSLGAGNHLIVHALILGLQQVVHLIAGDAEVVEALMDNQVNLVDDNPLVYLALVALEQRLAVFDEEVHQLTAGPAVVLQRQIQRHFVMANGNHRVKAVGNHAVNQIVIVFQALLAGIGVITVREDTRPVDGSAQAVHTGTGQQLDIFRIGVVEVDAVAFGVVLIVLLHGTLDIGGVNLLIVALLRRDVVLTAVDIGQAPALAAFLPGALHLVGGQCAAPDEVLRKAIVFAHLFHFRSSFIIRYEPCHLWHHHTDGIYVIFKCLQAKAEYEKSRHALAWQLVSGSSKYRMKSLHL